MTSTDPIRSASGPGRRAFRLLRRGIFAVLALLVLGAGTARAQDVIDQYQEARVTQRAQELLDVLGHRIVPFGPVQMPTSADTLRWLRTADGPGTPGTRRTAGRAPELGTLTWRKVTPSEIHWFDRRFSNVEWTAQGMRSPSVLDTIPTRVVRSKLQAVYGPPSNTIVDIMQEREPRGAEYIQFEYWFIINGEIPFIVLDVAGPFEDGLVFAGDLAYQDILTEAKRSLVEQIMQADQNEPYVDYYYSFDRQQWFLSGYTGERYFVSQIDRPDVSEGRPTVEEVDVPSQAASAADEDEVRP